MLRLLNSILYRYMGYATLLIVFFLFLAYGIQKHLLDTFDLKVSGIIQGMQSPNMTFIMKGFTYAGAGVCVTIIVLFFAMILYLIGYRKELFFYTSVIIASTLLNFLLKLLFHRARPDIHRIIEAAGYSFPSGHSMAAFTIYALTIYLLWIHLRYIWLRITVILVGSFMIIMIGVSRIYLGVHYPSDVIGGYLISAAWLIASIGAYERYLVVRWRLFRR